MKVFSEAVIFSWILLTSTDAQKESEYTLHPISQDWGKAQEICDVHGRSLLPVIGLEGFKKSGIFEDLEAEELVWLNAKDVKIGYPSRRSIHLKLAYIPADSMLTAYLCHNANNQETKKYVDMPDLSWDEADNECESSSGWTLLSLSSAKILKGAVSLLKRDVPFWVANMSKIPNVVSEKYNTDEMCLGVMKMTDGSLTYRRDNCTEKHKFVSVPSINNFALAITKMSRPHPLFSGEMEPDIEDVTNSTTTGDYEIDTEGESHDSESENEGMYGGIAGGAVGGVIAIVGVIVAVYFLRRRWRSRRDYLRSLKRYTQRHASSRGLLSHTMSAGNTLAQGNTLSGDTTLSRSPCKPDSDMSKQNDNDAMQAEYEECERRKYADCQNDVVRDIKTRYAKYPGPLSANAGLDMLPAYHSMNGNNTFKVLPAYERYDPDPGRLHGYVNKESHDQLSAQEQYDTVPKLPKKSGKKPNINDLDTYENQTTGNKSIMGNNEEGKHLGDPDKKICSLNELDEYENYKVPKREKGLFRMFKTDKANKAKKDQRKFEGQEEPASLNDLQAYESIESPLTAVKEISPSTAVKEIKGLSDLDAYENLAVKKI